MVPSPHQAVQLLDAPVQRPAQAPCTAPCCGCLPGALSQEVFGCFRHPSLLSSSDPRVQSLIGRLKQFGAKPTVAGFSQVLEVAADGSEETRSVVPVDG